MNTAAISAVFSSIWSTQRRINRVARLEGRPPGAQASRYTGRALHHGRRGMAVKAVDQPICTL